MGVIDHNNVAWEKCMRCSDYVEVHRMDYEPPSEMYKFGRDICPACYDELVSGAPAELPEDMKVYLMSKQDMVALANRIGEEMRRQNGS